MTKSPDLCPCDPCYYFGYCRENARCCPVYRHWTKTGNVRTKKRVGGEYPKVIKIEQIPDKSI